MTVIIALRLQNFYRLRVLRIAGNRLDSIKGEVVHEFSDKFQTAFDPPRFGISLQNFSVFSMYKKTNIFVMHLQYFNDTDDHNSLNGQG